MVALLSLASSDNVGIEAESRAELRVQDSRIDLRMGRPRRENMRKKPSFLLSFYLA
jgi:hypothetical protein